MVEGLSVVWLVEGVLVEGVLVESGVECPVWVFCEVAGGVECLVPLLLRVWWASAVAPWWFFSCFCGIHQGF